MRWLFLAMLFGCYEHHVLGTSFDGDVVRDGGPSDVAVDAPPEPCDLLVANRPVVFSRTPPYDSTLGSIATAPDGVVVAAFTSSNDAVEMDVSRWIMPLDPNTGAALLEDRVTVFDEPGGLTFVAHSHVAYPTSGNGIAYTWSAAQGCLVRSVGASGALRGGEQRIASDACLGARYSSDGRLYMAYRTEPDPPQRAYVVEYDRDFRERRRTGPSSIVGDAFHWTWTVDDAGTVHVAYADRDLLLYVGTWRDAEPVTRRVEASAMATLPRFVILGGELILAWREGAAGDMRAAFARVDSLEATITDLGVHLRSSWDIEPRGDELWVAYAEPGEHRDARVSLARFTNTFELRDTLRVGEERFPTRVRLETTPRGALLAYTGQRDDAEGGNQLFAAPALCL